MPSEPYSNHSSNNSHSTRQNQDLVNNNESRLSHTRNTASNSSSLTRIDNTYSPAVINLLEEPPASFPLRFIVGGLIFGIAFASWAWFGHIEEVGKAQGKLVPQGKTYKIEPTRSGKIDQLLIEEGDTVKAGEIIASLDGEKLSKEIDQIEQRLNSYQNQLSQQKNLLQVKRLEALNINEIASSDLSVQQIAIANAQQQINSQREQLLALQSEVAQNKQRLERLKPLEQNGAISQEYVFQAQQTLQESRMKLLNLQSELNSRKKEAERLQVELDQKRKQKTRTQLETKQQIQQLEINIEELQGKIIEANNQLRIAESEEKEMFLKSPINGTVLSLGLQNIGQVLEPGKTVAEIAPKDSSLVLDAQIPNKEAGFLKKDMDVKIKFDAYPYQDYGIVKGKVLSISPTSQTNDKGTFYKVEIALDRNYIKHNGQEITFQPGQSANAEIVIRRRRIAEVIFEPFQKLKEGGLNL